MGDRVETVPVALVREMIERAAVAVRPDQMASAQFVYVRFVGELARRLDLLEHGYGANPDWTRKQSAPICHCVACEKVRAAR